MLTEDGVVWQAVEVAPERGPLDGRRIVVVGASSGIGREVALEACGRGARAVVAGRRGEVLEELVREIPERSRAIVCDVTEEGGCDELLARAEAILGGVDSVVYAAGASHLVRLADAQRSDWQGVLATNLLGAAALVRASLGALRESGDPSAVFLSSHSVGDPWPGLVLYAASKAALDEMVRGLRAEEPWLRALRIVVGPTLTGFVDAWDPAAAAAALEEWASAGYLRHEIQEASDVARVVCDVLADPSRRGDLRVISGSVELL